MIDHTRMSGWCRAYQEDCRCNRLPVSTGEEDMIPLRGEDGQAAAIRASGRVLGGKYSGAAENRSLQEIKGVG